MTWKPNHDAWIEDERYTASYEKICVINCLPWMGGCTDGQRIFSKSVQDDLVQQRRALTRKTESSR